MLELSENVLDLLFGLPPGVIYLAIGLLCWAEAPFFLGFLTPGELAVAAGGALASRGQVSLGWLVCAAVAGTVVGNTMGYHLGRRWGSRILQWRLLQRLLGSSIDRVQAFMARRGEWAIVLSRLTSPARVIMPFLSGASGVPFRRYMMFDVPSAIAWAVVWGALGYSLGGSWQALQEAAGAAAFLVLGLFILALVIRWVAARIAGNRYRVLAIGRLIVGATGVPRLSRALAPAFRWMRRRFDPGLAHGLGVTVWFVALLGAVGAVGLVLIQIRAVYGLALLDFPALEWMSAARTEEAIRISRTALTLLHWPEVSALTLPLVVFLAARSGLRSALRVGGGLLGAAGAAYFLDRVLLEGVVPHAEYPSVPVSVAAALMVHGTAGAARKWGWGPSVATWATLFFLVCSVSLATLVAGWAAPTGIALGFALGLGWSTTLELPRAVVGRFDVGSGVPPPEVP